MALILVPIASASSEGSGESTMFSYNSLLSEYRISLFRKHQVLLIDIKYIRNRLC